MPTDLAIDAPCSFPLYVVPCLNEARHLSSLLTWLLCVQERLGGRIVVVDGGSTDGSQSIAGTRAARHDCLHLIRNPDRVQSAGINRAVDAYGETATHLIRIDAHAAYPDDYCDVLLAEAEKVGASSVVVSMNAVGKGWVQRSIAAAQNAPVGNGGSKHRLQAVGEFVDHGHHALMRLDAFRAVGGYDASFSHNEDAELDHRLRRAGYRIWLTGLTEVTYFPRETAQALWRQYFNFGVGRSKNVMKHRARPNARQVKVILVLPLVALAALYPASPFFAFPAVVWMSYCLTMALERAWAARDASLMLIAPLAMTMHVAWSIGFWWYVLKAPQQLTQRPA
ncbi:MAG: glycosyltransferase family 2 protein [Pseudomonadota bacterium]